MIYDEREHIMQLEDDVELIKKQIGKLNSFQYEKFLKLVSAAKNTIKVLNEITDTLQRIAAKAECNEFNILNKAIDTLEEIANSLAQL